MSMTTEVRRVLRPGGLYIFVEHVAAKGDVSYTFSHDKKTYYN